MLGITKCLPRWLPVLFSCSPKTDRAMGLPGSLPLLVPCTEHLAELEGRQVVGKLRHRKANPCCTFCALEFHSPAPAFSLEKPMGTMTGPPPRTKKKKQAGSERGDRLVPDMGRLPGIDAATM